MAVASSAGVLSCLLGECWLDCCVIGGVELSVVALDVQGDGIGGPFSSVCAGARGELV